MTATMDAPLVSTVPPVRQSVVDALASLLVRDDVQGFADAEQRLGATRAEVAAASAGLIDTGRLDLAALQHALEVLDGVAQLPTASRDRPA